MGKIYCILGAAEAERQQIHREVLAWALSAGYFSLYPGEAGQKYDLYVNHYIIAAEFSDYIELTQQYGYEQVIPICLTGSEYTNKELRELEIYRVYDAGDLEACIGDIIATEYNGRYIPQAISRQEEEQERNLPVKGEEIPRKEKQSKKERSERKESEPVETVLKGRVLQRKGLVVISVILILSIAAGFLFLFPEERPKKTGNASLYTTDGIDLMTNVGDHSYVFTSSGQKVTFAYTSACTMDKTLDKQKAIVSLKKELYYIEQTTFYKIADAAMKAKISSYGDSVYYFRQEEERTLLCRYIAHSKETVVLDEWSQGNPAGYKIIVSPDGSRAAVTMALEEGGQDQGYYMNQNLIHVIYENNVKVKEGNGITDIWMITDTGVLYTVDQERWLSCSHWKDEGAAAKRIGLLKGEYKLIWNSLCTEMLYVYYGEKTLSQLYIEGRDIVSLPEPVYPAVTIEDSSYDTMGKKSRAKVKAVSPSSYVLDVDSLRDLQYTKISARQTDHFISLYNMNGHYELEPVPKVQAYKGFLPVSDGSLYIYAERPYQELFTAETLYMTTPAGQIQQVIAGDEGRRILEITKQKSVYYISENRLFYRKGDVVKEIAFMINIDIHNTDMNFYAVEEEHDAIYFINNRRLYVSREGNAPVLVREDQDSLSLRLGTEESGIFYYVDHVGDDGVYLEDGSYYNVEVSTIYRIEGLTQASEITRYRSSDNWFY